MRVWRTTADFAEDVAKQYDDNGTISIHYRYENHLDDSPVITCRVYVDATTDAAKTRFGRESEDTQATIKQYRSEGSQVKRHDEWFSWGDESTVVVAQHQDGIQTFLFECRDGRRTFVLLIAGPVRLDRFTVKELLTPPLSNLERFGGPGES